MRWLPEIAGSGLLHPLDVPQGVKRGRRDWTPDPADHQHPVAAAVNFPPVEFRETLLDDAVSEQRRRTRSPMQSPTDDDRMFDAIVLGVGGMGSAACLELARRGVRVLGLEQYPLCHNRGSSHGESRIIRKAYFEHPDYVPLLHRAYDLWSQLESATGRKLLLPTGLVLSGPPEGETIRGARQSVELHRLQLENLSPEEAQRRFSGLVFPPEHAVAFESGAGTLLVDDCVRAHIDEAVRHGALIRESEPVLDWSTDGATVQVRTSGRQYQARSLVVTAGAWAKDLLKQANLPLRVLRKSVCWFPLRQPRLAADQGAPTYFYELPLGTFYGFPSLDGTTIKVAEHSGGDPVDDPATVDRELHSSDLVRLQSFVEQFIPDALPDPVRHSVCLYTVTPDQHFVIDTHPVWRNVVVGAGFSGHGFKFCPVVGEALADLALEGTTSLPIGFLGTSRPALRE